MVRDWRTRATPAGIEAANASWCSRPRSLGVPGAPGPASGPSGGAPLPPALPRGRSVMRAARERWWGGQEASCGSAWVAAWAPHPRPPYELAYERGIGPAPSGSLPSGGEGGEDELNGGDV